MWSEAALESWDTGKKSNQHRCGALAHDDGAGVGVTGMQVDARMAYNCHRALLCTPPTNNTTTHSAIAAGDHHNKCAPALHTAQP